MSEHSLHDCQIYGIGKVTIDEGIVSEKVVCKGAISVDSDCIAEVFYASGIVEIYGLLHANQVNLQLLAKCRVREICGNSIQVRMGSVINNLITSLPGLTKIMPDAMLKVDVIKGDRIELENTSARLVRGAHIHIGKGCRIGRLEYRDSYDLHSESILDDVVHI